LAYAHLYEVIGSDVIKWESESILVVVILLSRVDWIFCYFLFAIFYIWLSKIFHYYDSSFNCLHSGLGSLLFTFLPFSILLRLEVRYPSNLSKMKTTKTQKSVPTAWSTR
jgi:hypothetical protein